MRATIHIQIDYDLQPNEPIPTEEDIRNALLETSQYSGLDVKIVSVKIEA
jgi:hypothetical protein